ncbi:MAG: hypothetical protein SXV54_09340 [Chloroflexota bacterium]|nr:hypothetical protein [Chloroflexota bacterium]
MSDGSLQICLRRGHLPLAETRGEFLVTGDLRLYNAVRDHLD